MNIDILGREYTVDYYVDDEGDVVLCNLIALKDKNVELVRIPEWMHICLLKYVYEQLDWEM